MASTRHQAALEVLARPVTCIPNPGQVVQRWYGWCASRTRQAPDPHALPPGIKPKRSFQALHSLVRA